MYLLGPNEVYQVRLVTSSTWVPKDRIWAPKVLMIREGIIFTADDLTRLVCNLYKANTIAAQAGIPQHKGVVE